MCAGTKTYLGGVEDSRGMPSEASPKIAVGMTNHSGGTFPGLGTISRQRRTDGFPCGGARS